MILSNSIENEAAGIEGLSDIDNDLTINQMGNIVDLSLAAESDANAQISLVNLLGQQEVIKLSQNLRSGSNILALPDNLNGVYILSVIINGKQITKKLVF